MQDVQLKWFAARVIRDKSYVVRYLDSEGIRHAGISDIRSLLFIRCTEAAIRRIRYELFDRILVYRDPERHGPQSVPDRVMQTFLIMAPYHDEPVIYLSVDDPAFFEGRRRRVVSGIFAGCEGIIRRIKGQRRLIVRLSDRAAIATPYIPQEFLQDVEE